MLVERASRVVSRLTSVWSAHALSMYRILQLVAYSPGNFWKMAITKLNLEAIFNQMWVQDE